MLTVTPVVAAVKLKIGLAGVLAPVICTGRDSHELFATGVANVFALKVDVSASVTIVWLWTGN